MASYFRILSVLFVVLFYTHASGQDIELVKQTVTGTKMKAHIDYLASDELKGRDTGSEGLEAAAQYLANMFAQYGVEKPMAGDAGYFQTVKLIKPIARPSVSLTSDKSNGWSCKQQILLGGSNYTGSHKGIYLGYGLESDYKGRKVKGKVVIAQVGDGNAMGLKDLYALSIKKRVWAMKRGGVALVELAQLSNNDWQTTFRRWGAGRWAADQGQANSLPHIWAYDPNGVEKDKWSASGKDLNTIDLAIDEANYEKLQSKNVIGIVQGTDPVLKDEYIVYGAHYDHIGIGKPDAQGDSIFNGARDNAVGVGTVLATAENLALNPTKRSAIFILFTAEEKGLLGSKWYVDHPVVPMPQVVFCFNSDNAGYNDTSIATIVGLGRTTAANMIKDACEQFGLEAKAEPSPKLGLFDRSDNVHFATKGVPAPTFSMGFSAFDQEIRKYYHQTADNPESLDYAYLERFFKAYVLASRYVGNSPTKPFWEEGDKYYKKGKQLYEK